jgi:hypothetical protein
MRPQQKRRLGAEQAIYRKFPNFRECARACEEHAKKTDIKATFNERCIQQYVGCQTNLSIRRLRILAELLGVTNFNELEEIFTAPKYRGEGLWWDGDQGNRVRDLDMTMIDRFRR